MAFRMLGAFWILLAWGIPLPSAAAGQSDWEPILERVVPAVVALRVSATRPFDTDRASVVAATGFVVDARRGLILTNRHVVKPGPVTAEAVFFNHEKVNLRPVYRDPVHDFGFFRFDPAAVEFMTPGEIALDPEGARVGAEIRVVGNDAGEKLSILAGTLARLDRRAPHYGPHAYSDFNTFYYQAASGTSGGSSGAPVVDRSGRAVALNAGANRRGASSFFMPLDGIVRALERLQADSPIRRGTVQAVFDHRPYEELRRLGLRPETEAGLRSAHPSATGLLVVAETVPGGPAHGILEPGDLLIRVRDRIVVSFDELERQLDEAVGDRLPVEVERGGGPLALELAVQDLHEITPAAYLEVGGAVLHALSYHQARNHGLPTGGVYLASPGYAFSRAGIPGRVMITRVDGREVRDLEAFEAIVASYGDGARVPVRYFPLRGSRTPRVAVVAVDRRWFPMQRCERDDRAGYWACAPSPEPPPSTPPKPVGTRFPAIGPEVVRELGPSLVFVQFDVPLKLDGIHGSSFSGAGLVVDAESGLVVVDRDTVPISLGDLELTFANSVSIPGRVVALHPEHGLAAVRYDPRLLADTPVKSARLRTEDLEVGDELWLVGLDTGGKVVSRRTQVAGIDAAMLPLPKRPRFRETNLEIVSLTESAPSLGGVLADEKGEVLALWASVSTVERGHPRSFFAGIPADLVQEMVTPLREGRPFVWRSLGVELAAISLAEARVRGLGGDDAARLAAHDPAGRRVLAVHRVTAGTPAADLLSAGDLILGVNGRPATSFREVERAARSAEVGLRVLRNREATTLRVPTVAIPASGTARAIAWAGALLQRPPRALSAQRGIPRQGVYVAGRWRGSPAERYGLDATSRIVEVNGAPTPDLDSFLRSFGSPKDRSSVRLRTVDLEGKVSVLTLELDLHYWPTWELVRGREGWLRRER